MIYVILPPDIIGEVMSGQRRTLPVTDPAPVGALLALKTQPGRDATCLVDVTACEPDTGGHTLTVKPHIYEHQPLLLRAGSPLTGGGKARLLSARKRRPGKAKAPGGKFTEAQARGYTANPALSLADAGEGIELDVAAEYAARAQLRHAKTVRAVVAQARLDRELLSMEQRIVNAREAARMNYVDVRDEIKALKRMQAAGKPGTVAQLARVEAIAYRERRAA